MMSFPYFRFYTNDWLGSQAIATMTPAEEGAYIRLLAFAWNSQDCGLPDDDDKLAAISRLGADWHKGSGQVVRRCFFQQNGKLFNAKLLGEREHADTVSSKRSDAALQMHSKCRAKALQTGVGSGSGDGSGSDSGGSGSPSESSPPTRRKAAMQRDYTQHRFPDFWAAYPRREAKGAALDAYLAVIRASISTPDDMIAGAQRYASAVAAEGREMSKVKLPATWLNNACWHDEYRVGRPQLKSTFSGDNP
jgi:uncharacterized protein YdaU (DUF1376 family)